MIRHSATPITDDLVAELRRVADFDWRVPVSQSVAACTAAADEIERLRELLVAANDAFDETTGDYPKQLVANEPWRQFRTPEPHLG